MDRIERALLCIAIVAVVVLIVRELAYAAPASPITHAGSRLSP